MTDEQASNGNGFGKGILIGGLIGASLALLYTPKSGPELRKDVRKKANGFRTSLSRYTRRLKKQTNGLLEKALNTAEEAGEEVAHANRHARQHASRH